MERRFDSDAVCAGLIPVGPIRRILFGNMYVFFDVFDGGSYRSEAIFEKYGIRARISNNFEKDDSNYHNGRHEVNCLFAYLKGSADAIEKALDEVADACLNSDLGDAYYEAVTSTFGQ